MQVSRAPKQSSIQKNNNNTSISNSIQSQTSILPVERLRDQNFALKTNNSQKTNQTFPNIPNNVPPNQTVERNKKILPFVSHNKKIAPSPTPSTLFSK